MMFYLPHLPAVMDWQFPSIPQNCSFNWMMGEVQEGRRERTELCVKCWSSSNCLTFPTVDSLRGVRRYPLQETDISRLKIKFNQTYNDADS